MSTKVAVFPAGTEIGLELHQALQYATKIQLYGISSVQDHAQLVYRRIFSEAPYFDDPDFIPKLNQILLKNEIEYLYPAHDSVQLLLSRYREALCAKLIAPAHEVVEICRSKRSTYLHFHGALFLPHIYEDISQVKTFPVFAKPDASQGSIGARIIRSVSDYYCLLREHPNLVICEYLPGEECTVDCFSGTDGQLLCVVMRSRERIKAGISTKSRILPLSPQVSQIAHEINQRLRFSGAWFFQLRKNVQGEWKLLEIAPRIAGTSGLTRCQGFNLPLLTLYQTMGIPIELTSAQRTGAVDRALISRYSTSVAYQTVYLDLDDTLLLNQQEVNPLLMMFLYQAVNQKKRLVLLTRHLQNPVETLRSHRICPNLFHEILHLEEHQKKSDFITDLHSIFIDDSFRERKDVWERTGISTFDVDAVESLLDWRR